MQTQSYYSVLGVSATSTVEEIKKRYYELVVHVHPDKGGAEASVERFQLIQKAWETLRDTSTRKSYDSELQGAKRAQGLERIAGEIDLDEMEYNEGPPAKYTHPCRCGDWYSVTEEELEEGVDIVHCHGCSLAVKVLYEAAS